MEINDVQFSMKSTVPGEEIKQMYEIENFIPDHVCDEIVLWFKGAPKLKENGAQSFFNGRQINYEHIDSIHIKKLVNMYRYEATIKARELFKEKVYPDYTDLVFWDEGSGMLVHADNCDQDGNPNYVHWRKYSGVLYLNDDYLGGNTFFPDHGPKIIIPKKGKFVIYPAGLKYNHGVTTVVGKRYTMPIWFTSDINHIET